SGSVSHTNTLALTIGTFALAASPSSQTVSAGNNAPYTVTITTNSGFSGSVSFGLSGLPANSSATFSPTSLNGPGNSTLTVTTTAPPPPGATYPHPTPTPSGAAGPTPPVSLATAVSTPVGTGGSPTNNTGTDTPKGGAIPRPPATPLVSKGPPRLSNTNDTTA